MAEEIDVGMKCIKYMLFVANFMFVMIGFLLISIGSTIKAIYGDFETFMEAHYFSPATLAVAIGVIIFFVALFGCVGAIKESTCLINLFAFFLTLLLILEIAAAVAAYVMRGQIEETIRKKMEYSIEDYYVDVYDRKAWNFAQSRLFCCGIDGPSDWTNNFTTATTATTVYPKVNESVNIEFSVWEGPTSCCRRSRNDNDDRCLRRDVYKDGCLDALSYVVSESALLLGCGALAVSFIQMLGIIFAWMLAKAVRRLKTQELIDQDQNRQRIYEQLARGKDENPTPVLYTPTFSEA